MSQQPSSITPGFDAQRFGAVGDGVADDTAAIQAAIDAAAAVQGAVWFSPGVYACGRLQMRSHTALTAAPTWSYHRVGGASLRLNDPAAPCLIDLTGSIGARVCGLSLDGAKLGESVAGIFLDGLGHEEEETLVIENTRIAHFTGDGITLRNVWAYTVRDCMMIFNGGNGVTVTRWDGFFYHNIINNCQGYGIAMLAPNSAVTVIGNRIEWNNRGGIYIERGGHFNINDNYFDYCGGPAIHIKGDPEGRAATFAITGNLINRNGAKAEPGSHLSSHCLFEHVDGLVMTGNSLRSGRNDGGTARLTPDYGIVYHDLKESIISHNTLFHAATLELFVDLGGNDGQTMVKDNVGSVQAE